MRRARRGCVPCHSLTDSVFVFASFLLLSREACKSRIANLNKQLKEIDDATSYVLVSLAFSTACGKNFSRSVDWISSLLC